MFSLDDDESFDISEEDMLQAAMAVEDKITPTVPTKRRSFDLQAKPTGAQHQTNNFTNVSTDGSDVSKPLSTPFAKQDIGGSLFKLGDDSDDSQLDISIDSPIAWKPSLARQNLANELPLTTHAFTSDVKTLLSTSDVAAGMQDVFGVVNSSPVTLKPTTRLAGSDSRQNLRAQPVAQVTQERQSLLQTIANTNCPSGMVATCTRETAGSQSPIQHTSRQPDSPFTESDTSPAVFSTPKGLPLKRKRKFPGPAGLLPKLKPGDNLNEIVTADVAIPDVIREQTVRIEDLPSSQSTEDHFQDGNWRCMVQDLEPQATDLLKHFSVSSISRMASKKQLPNGKVPVLCAVIDTISFKNSDASVSLKDPTGTIRGTVHRDLVKEYEASLQPGAVLVLRQVGIFSPMSRNHYLNITPSNVVRVYNNDLEGKMTLTKINAFSAEDFIIRDSKPASVLNQTVNNGFHNSPGLRVQNSPRFQSSPRFQNSSAVGGSRPQSPVVPWNTIGRGVNQAMPRFIRGPQVGTNGSPQPGQSGVPHMQQSNPKPKIRYQQSSVSRPAQHSQQFQPSQGLSQTVQTPFPSINPQKKQPPQIEQSHRSPQTRFVPTQPAALQTPSQTINAHNANLNTRRLVNPQMPAGSGNTATPVSRPLSGQCVSRPSLHTGPTAQNVCNSRLSSSIQNANTGAFCRNTAPLAMTTKSSMENISPLNQQRPPLSNVKPAINTAPVDLCTRASCPHESTNIIKQRDGLKPNLAAHTPISKSASSKFTFKRTPSHEIGNNQQMSASSSTLQSMDTDSLWDDDPMEDLLSGVENELLSDDF